VPVRNAGAGLWLGDNGGFGPYWEPWCSFDFGPMLSLGLNGFAPGEFQVPLHSLSQTIQNLLAGLPWNSPCATNPGSMACLLGQYQNGCEFGPGCHNLDPEMAGPGSYLASGDKNNLLENDCHESDIGNGMRKYVHAAWGRDFNCMDQQTYQVPDAATCASYGTRNGCYQIPENNNCTVTYCPSFFRQMKGCKFANPDHFPIETVQGCIEPPH
jgi:hypothetical protein